MSQGGRARYSDGSKSAGVVKSRGFLVAYRRGPVIAAQAEHARAVAPVIASDDVPVSADAHQGVGVQRAQALDVRRGAIREHHGLSAHHGVVELGQLVSPSLGFIVGRERDRHPIALVELGIGVTPGETGQSQA